MDISRSVNAPQLIGYLSPAISALALVTLIACGLSGCDRQASTETLLQEAQRFQEKGDDKSAVIQLKNAL